MSASALRIALLLQSQVLEHCTTAGCEVPSHKEKSNSLKSIIASNMQIIDKNFVSKISFIFIIDASASVACDVRIVWYIQYKTEIHPLP